MKNIKYVTGKQASMTVTVKLANGKSIESFFFYDTESYGEILQAIHDAQLKSKVVGI